MSNFKKGDIVRVVGFEGTSFDTQYKVTNVGKVWLTLVLADGSSKFKLYELHASVVKAGA